MKVLRRIMPVVACVALVSAPSAAHATNPDTEHLPDLRTQTPSELRIDTSSGQKLLRFANVVVNLGDGRLELRPENSSTENVTRAHQGIYSHSASGTPYRVREQLVGTFGFHAAHNHWHFDNFAKYELLAVAAGGGPGASLKVSEKTTFCLIDTTQVAGGKGGAALAHAEPRRYSVCNQSSTTGISAGWGDRYGPNLSGQWVDVAGIPDGQYWLLSTVNYDGRLVEKDTTNNTGMVKIRITGNSVTIDGAPTGSK